MTADPLGLPTLGLHGSSLLDEPPVLTTHGAGPRMGTAIVETGPARDPQADFWRSARDAVGLESGLEQRVQQTLFEANAMTGQGQVLSNYGFTGAGQTVAVIDTGIASNHYALGGGVGAGYRVVGGWDFTENDANFYDDGPDGGHGTHVAGIVGARGDGSHSGVATGVDLVGLRVFDDAGNGYFSWVEQALRWVITNRTSFANPITAINLSLGAEWNSHSNPSWANLEDEFSQLSAAGVFISVSAGNSFTSYNTPGLSYPASSDHVIPVMSLDPNGQLSYFSQRATYAIAAPGRYITSTVPDYAANDSDTIDDDWLSMSGTSMAAPYVAGASALVRQAMEFVGQTGIDQWDIYNHLMATADSFVDSATATTYKKLNLWNAISTLMPTDDFGSTSQTAHNLGTVNASGGAGPLATVSGVIGTLSDSDYFRFTAGATGRVTVRATDATHELAVGWQGGGSGWAVDGQGNYVADVVAGQSYTFALATGDGLGYYDLSVAIESTFAPIEWGSIGPQETRAGLSVAGEQWYRVSAGRAGYFTAEALSNGALPTVELYDAQMNRLGGVAGRADATAAAGQSLYVRVAGQSSAFDLRLTNAVSVAGAVANVVGTSAADTITFGLSAASTLNLNGAAYTFSGSVLTVQIDAGAGIDSVTLNGSTAADAVLLRADLARMTSGTRGVSVTGHETVSASGGGGADIAYLYDTAGDDTVSMTPAWVTLTGAGFSLAASGFAQSFAYASAGVDTALVSDGAGDDRLFALPEYTVLQDATASYYRYAGGFDSVTAAATAGGADWAYLYDSAGDDQFVGDASAATLRGVTGTYANTATGFDNVFGLATRGGTDLAYLGDSSGDDYLSAGVGYAVMGLGSGGRLQANNFDSVEATATSGLDSAYLFDSAGDDEFTATSDSALLRNSAGSYSNRATGFDRTYAYASTGADASFLYGSDGNDVLVASPFAATLRAANGVYSNYAAGFDRNSAFALLGHDEAFLSDSSGDDVLTATPDFVALESAATGFFNQASGFDRAYAYASLGSDIAVLYDSAGADFFAATADYGLMESTSGSYRNIAVGFDTTTGMATAGGDDSAGFYDTAADDSLAVSGAWATLTNGSQVKRATGFDRVMGFGGSGGTDSVSLAAVDFAFQQVGSWA